MSLSPANGIHSAETDLYNKLMSGEMEAVRDFIILHYKQRAVFGNLGSAILGPGELFRETSWVAVMLGQGLKPKGYDPQADSIPLDQMRARLQRMRTVMRHGAEALPTHEEVLAGIRAGAQK